MSNSGKEDKQNGQRQEGLGLVSGGGPGTDTAHVEISLKSKWVVGKWADFEIGLQFFDVVNNKPKFNQLSSNSNLKRKIVDMGDDMEIKGPGVAKRALSINVLNDKDSDSGREILGGDLPAAFASVTRARVVVPNSL